MKRISIIIVYLIGCCVCGCVNNSRVYPPKTDVCLDGNIDFIPFALHKTFHAPIVEVTINGRGPYKFLLDTGSGSVSILNKLAEELHLPPSPRLKKRRRQNASGVIFFDSRIVSVDELGLGKTIFKNVDISAIEYIPHDGVSGILGFHIFMQLKTTLDFARKELRLERSSSQHKLKWEKWELPADYTDGTPNVPIVIGLSSSDPVEAYCTIDTGFNGHFQFPESIKCRIPIAPRKDKVIVYRADGSHAIQRYSLKTEVIVGNGSFTNTTISFSKLDYGLIGTGILQNTIVILDPMNKRASIEHVFTKTSLPKNE